MIIVILIYAAIAGIAISETAQGQKASLFILLLSAFLIDPALAFFAFAITQITTDLWGFYIKRWNCTGFKCWLTGSGSLSNWIGKIPAAMIVGFILIVSIIEYLT